MTNPWQHSELFKDSNSYMLDNEVLCDVTFLVGEVKEEMKCHKYMLVSRSPVFYTMFCGSLPENSGSVTIPDVEPAVWKLFIRFLYTMTCEMETETVMQLLYVAKKYDVPALIKNCEVFLNNNMTKENVCMILNQAILFEADELKDQCFNLVAENGSEVLNSKGFLTLSRESLKAVLELEWFEISGEMEVYTACKEWARQTCRHASKDFEDATQLRSELEDILPLIRFPTMSVETFVKSVSRDNILTDTEAMSVVDQIVTGEKLSKFPGQEREQLLLSFNVERLSPVDNLWTHPGRQDGISFTVTKPVTLTSVAMYLPADERKVTGQLEVLEAETIVLTQNVTLLHKARSKYEYVRLRKSVDIKVGITYSIRQRLSGAKTFRGEAKKSQSKQTVEDVTVEFTELLVGKSDNGTSLTSGQIHGITLRHKRK